MFALRVDCRIGKRPGSSLVGSAGGKLIKTEGGSTAAPPPMPDQSLFSNDGNFLERFRQIQQQQPKGKKYEGKSSHVCVLCYVNKFKRGTYQNIITVIYGP